ncbi:hypothetical protein GCM10009733_020800 [Nonomuraea maheshkhaliensis]|uniref:DUF4262 domain-containing protein n=1 Tax=Nonomuraea maheshkhaliensis TaxID=419590 RepID=A0ABP4R0C2_9ACTN
MSDRHWPVLRAAISDHIRNVGWALQGVGDPTTPWIYTIGLCDRGHPELIITGINFHAGGTVLNRIGTCVRRGLNVSNPSLLAKEFGHDPAVLNLRPVDPTWHDTHLFNIARSYWGSDPATMQVVMADKEGRFPWDTGHQLGIDQPQLWEPWPGGWPNDPVINPEPGTAT